MMTDQGHRRKVCVIPHMFYLESIKIEFWGLPDSPVVKAPHSQCMGPGLIPGWGTQITHATAEDATCGR